VERVEQDGVVTYTVTDSSGNKATATREINYDDPIPPELNLLGDSTVTITAGTAYTDPGWDASDNVDGDLNDAVEVTDTVDVYLAGTYTVTYSVTDSYGNTTTAERTVNVQAVPQPDVVMPNGKIIYLTFDDGPGPYTEDLLAVLAKYNVKVTFFTVNTKYISLVKEEIEAGHSVGIHSATHDYAKIYTSEDAYFADLKEQQDIIYNLTGVKTTLIRFPGGSSNAVSKHYCTGIMTRLTQAVTDQGFQYFDWNVTSGDAGETTSTDKVFENVVNGVKNRNVSIVLQHDIKKFSVDAVEKIITWGLANGYTFLPLDSTSPTAHHSVNN
jgi:peptidoglycan/xylan/chitin deacetylase (PgdA/CDA1 family)